MFDAGEATIQTLGALSLPIRQIKNVFITHWHSDHFGGLGQVMNETWMELRSTPLSVYGPYGVKQITQGLNQAYQLDAVYRQIKNMHTNLNTEFMVPHLVNPSEGSHKPSTPKLVYADRSLKVSAFLVNHSPVVPALGYQVTLGNCTLVISGDTKIIPRLSRDYQHADALVSEAFSHIFKLNQQKFQAYTISPAKAPKLSSAKGPTLPSGGSSTFLYHTDSWALAKLAQKSGVKHIVLTHLIPPIKSSVEAEKLFISGMKKFYKGHVYVAHDTSQFTLTPSSNGCQFRWLSSRKG